MHYMEAPEELGERLKCRMHNNQKDSKDEKNDYYLKNQEALVWTSI
jgi:hypothetical protein